MSTKQSGLGHFFNPRPYQPRRTLAGLEVTTSIVLRPCNNGSQYGVRVFTRDDTGTCHGVTSVTLLRLVPKALREDIEDHDHYDEENSYSQTLWIHNPASARAIALAIRTGARQV